MLWMKESGEIHMPLTAKATPESLPAPSSLDARIYSARGRRVMLDSDLAEVYGVETGALNRAVNRNQERFPDEFAFRLNAEEWDNLKCQIGISSSWGGRRRALPRVFTEYAVVFDELKRLAVDLAPERPRERIGFRPNKERGIIGRARRK
jgi:hypothetical protein